MSVINRWHNAVMSESERIKEELAWLKVVFAIGVAVDVSLIAWLAQNYTSANSVTLFMAFIVIIGLTVGAVLVNHVVYRLLRKLEKL